MRLLCLNVGSSSLKAACFVAESGHVETSRIASKQVERIGDAGEPHRDHVEALGLIADELERDGFEPNVIAHRVVHGGPRLVEHVVIDDAVLAELEAAVSFAPLHLPAELSVISAARTRYEARTQVACIDTAFHRNIAPAARRLPIPASFDARGVRRYGFHGLSYEYLVHRLGAALGRRAVLAHLGSGASMAAVSNGIGVDTTSGFTPTGGLVMGTRTGDLDPGVLIHMLRTRALDANGLEHIIDQGSGLLGLSGRSSDVRDLLVAHDDGDETAGLALEVFERTAAKHLAALTTVLGGLDVLVFTAGVGEHAAPVRAGIVDRLAHLGVTIDPTANQANASVISRPNARVTVRIEPTDEEFMMAVHATRLARA
jgi:acetate kinase